MSGWRDFALRDAFAPSDRMGPLVLNEFAEPFPGLA
jgi:hypothetical protein